MIPKKMHYCWFGRGKKPEIVEKCIESWKLYCPDFEIIEWNEDNFDVNSHPFMKEAYENKKWAFVVDVARLLIIQEHGGVYLDTDVELFGAIDDWLNDESVFFFESIIYMNLGMGFSAVQNHPLLQKLIDSYTKIAENYSGNIDFKNYVSPPLNTEVILNCHPEIVMDGNISQRGERIFILAVEDYSKYAIHYGSSTWVEGPLGSGDRTRSRISELIQSKMQNPKIFQFIKKYLGERCFKLYVFMAYDFFDSGILYFVKRILHRIERKFEIKSDKK